MIRYGLNGSTTMPLDQAAEIKLAAAAGFDFIELRAPKIEQFLKTGTIEELLKILEASGLKVLSINAIECVNTRGHRGEKDLMEEGRRLASWAHELNCPYIITVPGFLESPRSEAEIIRETVTCLAALAEIARTNSVRLGFEFLGFSNCTVNTFRLGRKIVEQLAPHQVGLVIDTFHFFISAESLEELSSLKPGDLYIFHVNDVENLPRESLKDEHRILPGDGVIPLRELWNALRQRQLVDHASIELFRPEYWLLPPNELMQNALVSMRRVFC